MTPAPLAWPAPELHAAARRAASRGAPAQVCLTVRQAAVGWTLFCSDGLAPQVFLSRPAAQHSAFRLAAAYVRVGRCACVLLVDARGVLLGASRLAARSTASPGPPFIPAPQAHLAAV